MTRKVLALVLAVLAGLVVLPPAVSADVLLIEEVRQADSMNLPTNGMTTGEVRARYGEPLQTHPAVGVPPIARWDYDKWSVYFEYDLVLYSVLHKDAVNKKDAK